MDHTVEATPEGQIELLEGAAKEAARLAKSAPSAERIAFVQGLLDELQGQTAKHIERVMELAHLQAQLEIGERNLIATRDYLNSVLSQTKETVPHGWQALIRSLRFLGARLGDACVQVLRESEGPLEVAQIEGALNAGQYRFRTGTPRREIHAALLRQPRVKRTDDGGWFYTQESGTQGRGYGPRRKGAGEKNANP
ncbi:MAG: hypothetical protein GEU28_04310 [Dehalococcoidia bacterium]|nr:hypothetical protein [Dehalococcoidia bacterium]